MVIYRPHCGGLAESMKEAGEFDGFEEMKRYIVEEKDKIWSKRPFEIEDIIIGDIIGDDWRIGWKNCRHVCLKRFLCKDFREPFCIGLCATDYPEISKSIQMMQVIFAKVVSIMEVE